MIAGLALTALGFAVFDDEAEGQGLLMERFRVLYALGDKRSAYALLFKESGPVASTDLMNGFAQWVGTSPDLDTLAVRLKEYEGPIWKSFDMTNLHHKKDPVLNARRFMVRTMADNLVVMTIDNPDSFRPEIQVPVYGPAPANVRQSILIANLAEDPKDPGRNPDDPWGVTSWDATRILATDFGADLEDPLRVVMVPLGVGRIRFYGNPLARTPMWPLGVEHSEFGREGREGREGQAMRMKP